MKYSKKDVKVGAILDLNGSKLKLIKPINSGFTYIDDEVVGNDYIDDEGNITPAELRSDPAVYLSQRWLVDILEPYPFSESGYKEFRTVRKVDYFIGNYKIRTKLKEGEVVRERKLTIYKDHNYLDNLKEENLRDEFDGY